MLNVNYDILKDSIAETIHEINEGIKNPIRKPNIKLQVIKGLQGEVTAGKFIFRTDAALDAGGFAEHPKPMDYLLGALASCQQMWCLRWCALTGKRFADLQIEAESVFSWRGEYLEEIDSGMTELHVAYLAQGNEVSKSDLVDMANMVAKRCPVFSTLRKAVLVKERIELNNLVLSVREWAPGKEAPLDLPIKMATQ